MPTEPKKYKCPHCDEEIEAVDYFCYTNGKEWGTAYISTSEDYFEDHEYNDSEITDSDDYEYQCQKCKKEVTMETLIKNEEEKNEDGNKIEEKTPPKIEKLLSNPNNIFSNNNDETKNCIECPICRHLNILEEDENSCDCVNCSTFIEKPTK